jgi:hypothetical protein
MPDLAPSFPPTLATLRAAPVLALLVAFALGGLAMGLLTWAVLARPENGAAPLQQAVAADQNQLKAFRQYAMSFSMKMAGAQSVDVSGQFASATIRFHPLPAPPELFASTNIRRWTYSFSKIQVYQGYFVFLVFDQPLRDFKVRAIQNDGSVPMEVEDASERTLLLKFIGEPAERAVTIDVLPR